MNVTSEDINLLLLSKQGLVFFGLLVIDMKKMILESKDENCYVYCNNKTIVYVCPKDTRLDAYIGLTIHICLHLLSMHPVRIRERNEVLWNLAADHVVNRELLKIRSKYVAMPPNYIFFKSVHDSYPNITVEELYEQFLEKEPGCCACKTKNGSSGIFCLDDYPWQDADTFKEIILEKLSLNNQTQYNGHSQAQCNGQTVSADLLKLDQKTGKNEESFTEEEIERLKDMANQIITDEQTINGLEQGLGSSIKGYIKKILEIKIPWDIILKRALRNALSENTHKTWARKNRICPHLKIPGNMPERDGMGTILVSLDTSGSISEQQLEKLTHAISQSVEHYRKVIVILHSHEVYNVLYLEEPTKDKVVKFIMDEYSFGGTSHLDVFKTIEKIIFEGDYLVSSIIFMTDFESDVEKIYKDFEWMQEYETIWLLTKKNVTVNLEGCKTLSITLDM